MFAILPVPKNENMHISHYVLGVVYRKLFTYVANEKDNV